MQLTKDGRRILWMAHESAPKNYTAVDVTDPRHAEDRRARRSAAQPHALQLAETVGDILAIAYQTQQTGDPQAGVELLDISTPESPKRIAFFDAPGRISRGVHQLWFADGDYIHMSSGAADFRPTHPNDDQFYQCIDVRNPSKPVEIGRWWLPGTNQGDNVARRRATPAPASTPLPAAQHQRLSAAAGSRLHGYIDGGMIILDIADKGSPKMVSRWDYHPPYPGFTHTVVPFFERNLLVVSDEATRNDGGDWPKLVWIVDNRVEGKPGADRHLSRSLPSRPSRAGGGRFGAHNLWENLPKDGCWKSENIVLAPSSTAGCAPSTCRTRSSRRRSRISHRRSTTRRPAPARSTTSSSTIAASCSALIAMPRPLCAGNGFLIE